MPKHQTRSRSVRSPKSDVRTGQDYGLRSEV
jgi:hypothetical protein